MAGLSEGSPAILCRYRITANTPPLQGGDAGSTPLLAPHVAVTVRHDVKLGEHGPLVVRCPNVDETASKIIDKQVLCLKVFESPGVSRE